MKLAEAGVTKATAPESEIPVVQISLQAQVDGGRNPKNMQIITYVPQDMPISEFNVLLDKLGAVTKRQTAIFELDTLEDRIRHELKQVELIHTQMARIDTRRAELSELDHARGKRTTKAPENEEQNRRSLLDKLESARLQIEGFRELADELKAQIHGGIPNGVTDNTVSV